MTGAMPGSRYRSSYADKARGVVLVAVLWVVVILLVLASGITSQYRTQQRIVGNRVVTAQTEAAAEGGVSLLLGVLREQLAGGRKVMLDVPHRFRLGDIEVTARIRDERGRVDLNRAPPELLRGVFLAAGVDFDTSDALADAVLDWRDEDQLRRLHGAEDDDYRRAGLRYEAKDAPFDSVDELQQVLGMTEAIYRKVREGFTVYTEAANINPVAAPRLVLEAIPGATAEIVNTYMETRTARLEDGLPPPPFPLSGQFVTSENGPAYSLEAEAVMGKRARARVRAVVVHVPGASRKPLRIAAWESTGY